MKPPLKTASRLSKTPNEPPTLLVADDHAWFRSEVCQALLKECGIRTLQASNGLGAIRAVERNPQLVAIVIDKRFDNGGPDGEEVLDTVRERWPHVRRMLLTAYVDGGTIERGLRFKFAVRDKAVPMSKLAKSVCEWFKNAA